MGLFANAFTWWNGASWTTSLFTKRFGVEVGRDDSGNIYYRHDKDTGRRWVIYDGSNDSSRVPPGWNAWLRGTIDEVPSEALPAPRAWEQPPVPNLTGTPRAYTPGGSMRGKAERQPATGDYQAWTPE